MISNLRELRKRLLWLLGFLLVVDVATGAFLLSPLARSREELMMEKQSLEARRGLREREVAPLRQIDRKLKQAATDLDKFYAERVPTEASALADRLGKLAAKNDVQISQVKYTTGESELNGLRQVTIKADLSADYLDLTKFLNALERDPMFFVIQRITLNEGEEGQVRLNLELETYLKQES
ncbi:MAG TPA: GspMb/PilO family protein [Terriglobales bacterium]|nr:GspMb/PilO family protein [Terriglobales bacterium]